MLQMWPREARRDVRVLDMERQQVGKALGDGESWVEIWGMVILENYRGPKWFQTVYFV